jgi:hypothetical protein
MSVNDDLAPRADRGLALLSQLDRHAGEGGVRV